MKPWTNSELEALARAQSKSAVIYRKYQKCSPWNSKTRQGWRQLAITAERLARFARAEVRRHPTVK